MTTSPRRIPAGARAATIRSISRCSPARAVDTVDIDRALDEAPELACLRGVIPERAILQAVRRARRLDTGADRVAIQRGMITEPRYIDCLAQATRIFVAALGHDSSFTCPASDSQRMTAAATGILPVELKGKPLWLIAPQGMAARHLSHMIRTTPERADRYRLTTTATFNAYLRHLAHGPLATLAVHGVAREASAAPRTTANPRSLLLLAASSFAVAATLTFPAPMGEAALLMLSCWFLSLVLLRFYAALCAPTRSGPAPRLRADRLPVYTVIAALYREAGSVGDLLASLRRLDYPPEKLDIKLVIEPDDAETSAAIAALDLPPNVEVIIAIAEGPRTKPKALNCALPFARGLYTVIYDAEDRPHPLQLRAALEAFRGAGERVACAQARLCIDNPADGWIAAMFAAEYAGHFDVLLPSLVRLGIPIPLGGTSNHFRTDLLRAVGAWDPYNVTEDADLGIRLARHGYRTVMVDSTTYEEAPARAWPWLRQRTRWMKGWMQTWLVHMRHPVRLWREIGGRGVIALNVVVGGGVVTALAHGVFVLDLALTIVEVALGSDHALFSSALSPLHLLTLGAGYVVSVLLALIGLARRDLLDHAGALAFVPLQWLMLSVAAWRALYQLFRQPYHWEKTEHGLARTSRFVARMLALARYRKPSAAALAGETIGHARTTTSHHPRDNAANPPQPRRQSA